MTLVRNPFDAGGYSLAEMTQADPALMGSMIGKTAAQLKKAGADLAAGANDFVGGQRQRPFAGRIVGGTAAIDHADPDHLSRPG